MDSFDLPRLPLDLVRPICDAVLPEHLVPTIRIYTHYPQSPKALATLASLTQANRLLYYGTAGHFSRFRDAFMQARRARYGLVPHLRTVLQDSRLACQETTMFSGYFERLNLQTPDGVLMIDQAAGSDSAWSRIGIHPGHLADSHLKRSYDPQRCRCSELAASIYEIAFQHLPNLQDLAFLTSLTLSKSLLGKYDLVNMCMSYPALESSSWESINEASQHRKDRAQGWKSISFARFCLLMLDNAPGALKTLPRLRKPSLGRDVLIWSAGCIPKPKLRRAFLVDLLPPSLCVLELLNCGSDLLPAAIRLLKEIEAGRFPELKNVAVEADTSKTFAS
ncbi:hypothetical protein SCUP234_04845 [Seiridium cupressi]